jgi:ParB family chromosome partitioning protein
MAKLKPKTKTKEETRPVIEDDVELMFKRISLDLIDDPEQPMRSDMTEGSVADLILSIKQVGIIEPVVVKPVNDRYEVIAGHRRTYAARLAHLVDVPCYVRKANKEQTEMLKIHENLYRAEITPPDEAKHFAYLINKQKLTPPQIAKLISKSLTYVMDRIGILDYPEVLSEAMHNGDISFSVAKEFARFDDPKQLHQAIKYAKVSGMTQEMARKWVQDFKRDQGEQQSFAPPESANGEATSIHDYSATCIYCRKGLRLQEAEVVYMHRKCKDEADQLNASPELQTQALVENPTLEQAE